MSSTARVYVKMSDRLRSVSEPELLRAVSQITWKAKDQEESVSAIAELVLRVPGFTGFKFDPRSALSSLSPYQKVISPSLKAFASSPVVAYGQNWGEIRIFLDPQSLPEVESPARLVRFVGQQIGMLFQRLAMQSERRSLISRLEKLSQVVRRRKLIYAAAGVFARQRNSSGLEAISEMVKYARSSRRKLFAVSESLILGQSLSKPTRYRRVPGHQAS